MGLVCSGSLMISTGSCGSDPLGTKTPELSLDSSSGNKPARMALSHSSKVVTPIGPALAHEE